jgi:hypothetical protein
MTEAMLRGYRRASNQAPPATRTKTGAACHDTMKESLNKTLEMKEGTYAQGREQGNIKTGYNRSRSSQPVC